MAKATASTILEVSEVNLLANPIGRMKLVLPAVMAMKALPKLTIPNSYLPIHAAEEQKIQTDARKMSVNRMMRDFKAAQHCVPLYFY